jgi:4-hydroxy-tetrahydrodipicolinate reductase
MKRNIGKVLPMIKLCVAGASGRMGSTIVREAVSRGFEIVGAIAASDDPSQGKTLRELGLCNSELRIVDPSGLQEAVENADVYVSFTSPDAELSNMPIVAGIGKRIVMGTTGFTDDQMNQLKATVSSKVPAVFAPNFAIGINVLLNLVKSLETLPKDYDFSVIEMHHSKKKDAPSGTAMAIAKQISQMRGYGTTVYGRSGISLRKPEEIEVVALRGGGIPGVHQIVVAGPHEMLMIEHFSLSRSVFAHGALYAAEWIAKQTRPGVYSLNDVLSG